MILVEGVARTGKHGQAAAIPAAFLQYAGDAHV